MSGIGFVFTFLLGLVLAALMLDLVHGYRSGDGSIKDKLLAAGKDSASILVARVGMIGGFGLQAIVVLSDAIASPGVKAFVDQYMNANAVGYTMIAAALIAEIARRRTLTVPVLGQSGGGDK